MDADPWNIREYSSLESTNTEAYTLAESESAGEWTVLVADRQTSGHGRKGKRWESPTGGLWFSIILRPNISAENSPLLQFYAANSARNAIEKISQTRCLLKWPNDLVMNGKKVGGILVETKLAGSQLLFTIIGTGINLNIDQGLLPAGATSILGLTGRSFDRREALQEILSQLHSRYAMLNQPDLIVREWWENCAHRNRHVKIELPDSSTVEGLSVGIEPSGQLILRTDDAHMARVEEGTLRTHL